MKQNAAGFPLLALSLSVLGASEPRMGSPFLVRDINSTPVLTSCLSQSPMTASGGLIYFVGSDSADGAELWRTDGTLAGTRMARDVLPGAYGSYPYWLTDLGGTLVFVSGGPQGSELWRSDGTPERTERIKTFRNADGISFLTGLVNGDGTLFFAVENDDQDLVELWRSDGTETGTLRVFQRRFLLPR